MRTIMTALVALAIAIGTTILARGWLESGRQRQVAAAQPMPVAVRPEVKVMVAVADLAPGVKLKSEHVRWQIWPESGIAKEYLLEGKRSVAELEGVVIRYPIVAGQPIMLGSLIDPGDRSALAAIVSEGMRAMTVAIDDITGHAGLVLPGDHVDVILTQVVDARGVRSEGGQSGTRRVSETVLANVRVIATGKRLSGFADEDAQKSQLARTVTLEVTPNDAQRLALVSELGRLTLALHGVAVAETGGEAAASGLTWDSAVSKALDAGSTPARRIVVMRGGTATTVVAAPTAHATDPAKESVQ